MANQSIYNAFERMWQHVINKLNNKANKTDVDIAISEVNASIGDITSGTTPVKEAEHATNADSAINAEYAATADTATTATKATQDGNGKVIADTYETKVDAIAKLD
jgi:hypothetical protein